MVSEKTFSRRNTTQSQDPKWVADGLAHAEREAVRHPRSTKVKRELSTFKMWATKLGMRSNPSYVTSFCNRAHDTKTGKPIGHECYILHPVDLMREREGLPIPGGMRKLGIHKGLKRFGENPTGSRSRFTHTKLARSSGFDKRSFRTVKLPSGKRVVIGCPKGKWSPSKGRCRVGTRGVAKLTPKRKNAMWGTKRYGKGDTWLIEERDDEEGYIVSLFAQSPTTAHHIKADVQSIGGSRLEQDENFLYTIIDDAESAAKELREAGYKVVMR